MSQTLLEKANRTTFIDPMMNHYNPAPINPPKSNNYEFKFDEIETSMVAKEKLKDYLRAKVNRASRSSTIGPASFYGVRQNINQKKISNKQKFLQKEDSPRKESIKVIKFV